MAILPKPEMYPDWQSWANSVVQQLENTEPEVQDRAVSTKFPAAEAKFNLGRIVYTVDQSLLKYSNGVSWQTLASETYVDGVNSLKVDRAGDTMTGNLTIDKVAPSIFLKKTSGNSASITSYVGANPRWNIQVGNDAAESGSNAGSNFAIRDRKSVV